MSPEDVCNAALDQIRARATIQSLSPPIGSSATAAAVAARNYQPRIDGLLRAVHWNFARFQAPLTLLRAAAGTPENPSGTTLPLPPFPHRYEYAWPTVPVCLKIIRLLRPDPSTVPGASNSISLPAVPVMPNAQGSDGFWSVPNEPFSVAADLDQDGNQVKVILTNVELAQAVYVARIDDPTQWDALFLDAATMLLAAWFCEPVTGSEKLVGGLVAQLRDLVMQARIANGNEGPQTVDRTPDYLSVRGFYLPRFGGSVGRGSWDTLGLPGGIGI